MMVRIFYTFLVEGFCPANSEKRSGKAGGVIPGTGDLTREKKS
jgi:hypothetical protein